MVEYLSHYEMGCVDVDNKGVTALMLALQQEKYDFAKLLAAEAGMFSYDNKNALQVVVRKGFPF